MTSTPGDVDLKSLKSATPLNSSPQLDTPLPKLDNKESDGNNNNNNNNNNKRKYHRPSIDDEEEATDDGTPHSAPFDDDIVDEEEEEDDDDFDDCVIVEHEPDLYSSPSPVVPVVGAAAAAPPDTRPSGGSHSHTVAARYLYHGEDPTTEERQAHGPRSHSYDERTPSLLSETLRTNTDAGSFRFATVHEEGILSGLSSPYGSLNNNNNNSHQHTQRSTRGQLSSSDYNHSGVNGISGDRQHREGVDTAAATAAASSAVAPTTTAAALAQAVHSGMTVTVTNTTSRPLPGVAGSGGRGTEGARNTDALTSGGNSHTTTHNNSVTHGSFASNSAAGSRRSVAAPTGNHHTTTRGSRAATTCSNSPPNNSSIANSHAANGQTQNAEGTASGCRTSAGTASPNFTSSFAMNGLLAANYNTAASTLAQFSSSCSHSVGEIHNVAEQLCYNVYEELYHRLVMESREREEMTNNHNSNHNNNNNNNDHNNEQDEEEGRENAKANNRRLSHQGSNDNHNNHNHTSGGGDDEADDNMSEDSTVPICSVMIEVLDTNGPQNSNTSNGSDQRADPRMLLFLVGCDWQQWDYILGGPLAKRAEPCPPYRPTAEAEAAEMGEETPWRCWQRRHCYLHLLYPSGMDEPNSECSPSQGDLLEDAEEYTAQAEYDLAAPRPVLRSLLGVAMRVWAQHDPHLVALVDSIEAEQPTKVFHSNSFWQHWPREVPPPVRRGERASLRGSRLRVPLLPGECLGSDEDENEDNDNNSNNNSHEDDYIDEEGEDNQMEEAEEETGEDVGDEDGQW